MIPYKSKRLKDINKTCVHIWDLFAISVTMNEIKVSVPEFLVLNQKIKKQSIMLCVEGMCVWWGWGNSFLVLHASRPRSRAHGSRAWWYFLTKCLISPHSTTCTFKRLWMYIIFVGSMSPYDFENAPSRNWKSLKCSSHTFLVSFFFFNFWFDCKKKCIQDAITVTSYIYQNCRG